MVSNMTIPIFHLITNIGKSYFYRQANETQLERKKIPKNQHIINLKCCDDLFIDFCRRSGFNKAPKLINRIIIMAKSGFKYALGKKIL